MGVYCDELFQSFAAVKTAFFRSKSSLLLFRHHCVLFSYRQSLNNHSLGLRLNIEFFWEERSF